jgi:sensor histidine kinase regulating citrate/malate metabolism
MDVMDLYALFGNALDNAVESVKSLEDNDKRVINVKIFTQGQLLMIQVQNYYEGDLSFSEGLPVTTKNRKKEHGYGLKSIKHTVEKYGGSVTIHAESQLFGLQILLPLPQRSPTSP